MDKHKPYILLVQDDSDVTRLAAKHLADPGFEIKTAVSAAEARTAIKEAAPLLMLLDYALPGENGLEFVQSFKARGEACPPFIVMTGRSSEEVAVAMLRAGARDFFVKGISVFDPLKSAVTNALAELKSARELEASHLRLKESEERLKDSQRLAKVGNWDLDVATGAITGSEEYCRLFGLDPAQPLPGYEERLKVYTPESAARLDAAVKLSLRTGEPYELDLEFVRPQGECLWVSARSTAKRDARGRIMGLYGTVQDITARKQAENELREKEYLLSESQRLGHIGSWFYKQSGQIVWSEELYRLYGVSPAAFSPTPESFLTLIHPEDRAAIRSWNTDCAEGKKPGALEYRSLLPDGNIRFLYGTGQLMAGVGGTYIVGAVQDITERKRVEEQRAQSEARLNEAQKVAKIGSWETLLADFSVQWSDETYSIFGVRKADFHQTHQGFMSLIHPEDRAKVAAAFTGSIGSKNQSNSIEHRIVTPSGIKFVEEHWRIFCDEQGRPVRVAGVCHDITERKQAEKKQGEMQLQIQQSQKMESIGLLAGGVAHDFNNILTAIKGYCTLVTNTLKPEDPNRKDMGEIMTAADRASTLTRQLLAFSRKQALSPKIIDLNEMIRNIVNMLRRIIGEEIKLSIKLHSAPCFANVDPGQIEQLIMNLALNARDAVSKGGEITLETESLIPSDKFFAARPDLQRGPMVCIKVRDNGSGMSQEAQQHLFEPFYTTKAQGKGTGLGLPMVFGIVKQSRGGIEVESEPGKGSVFMVYFPLSEAPLQDKDKDKEPSIKGHEIILLVEDEESLRRLGERVLRAGGYTVLVAADGKAALKLMEERGSPVDLLITDLVMPGMSGRELAAELARRKLTPRTLYMSGYTDDAIAKHGVLESGIAFIYKPFSVEALSIKLREVLDGPADKAKA